MTDEIRDLIQQLKGTKIPFVPGDVAWRGVRIATSKPCDYCEEGFVFLHHRGEVERIHCLKCKGTKNVTSYTMIAQKEIVSSVTISRLWAHGHQEMVSYTFEHRSPDQYYGPLFNTREECIAHLEGVLSS
jgi:hypothetical protein